MTKYKTNNNNSNTLKNQRLSFELMDHRDHNPCAPFSSFAVHRHDVGWVASQPLCSFAAEVNQLQQQRRTVVFERDALHLIEEHLRVVIADDAVAGQTSVAQVEDEKGPVVPQR